MKFKTIFKTTTALDKAAFFALIFRCKKGTKKKQKKKKLGIK